MLEAPACVELLHATSPGAALSFVVVRARSTSVDLGVFAPRGEPEPPPTRDAEQRQYDGEEDLRCSALRHFTSFIARLITFLKALIGCAPLM